MKPDAEENDEKLPDLPDVETPPIEAAPGSMAAAEEMLKAKLKAYEDSILTLQAKRNQINGAIKHRRAQAQAMLDALKAFQRHKR